MGTSSSLEDVVANEDIILGLQCLFLPEGFGINQTALFDALIDRETLVLDFNYLKHRCLAKESLVLQRIPRFEEKIHSGFISKVIKMNIPVQTKLVLCGGIYSESDLQLLSEALSSNKNITELMAKFNFSSSLIESILGGKKYDRLTELNLYRYFRPNMDNILASMLPSCQHLRSFMLVENDFCGVSGRNSLLEIMMALQSLLYLSEVNLSHNKIDGEAAIQIAEVVIGCPNVRCLNLGNCGIDSVYWVKTTLIMAQSTAYLEGRGLTSTDILEALNLPAEVFRYKSNKEILDYLRKVHDGTSLVLKCRLLLVGQGRMGKTTLVHRLATDVFKHHEMTDGINMTKFTIGGMEFNVMDFAGQREYLHTHQLFFTDECLYLAVHNAAGDVNELKSFLRMIGDVAPVAYVVLVITRATEREFSESICSELLKEFPSIKEYIEVDSKNGFGFSKLRESLMKGAVAMRKFTAFNVLNSHAALQRKLSEMSVQYFSLQENEVLALGREIGLDDEGVELAVSLFCAWGMVYKLSNGALVLKPQQLADVFACIFSKVDTTLDKLSNCIVDGVLSHARQTLSKVWGEHYDEMGFTYLDPLYPTYLWDDSTKFPAFINLLHDSGLAYPLYDEKGETTRSSLIPSLLPEYPMQLRDSFSTFASEGNREIRLKNVIHLLSHCLPVTVVQFATIVLCFASVPKTFFARLLVKLRYMAVKNGSWKTGCFLTTKDVKRGLSFAVLYFDEISNSMIIISAGRSTTARSIVMHEIVKLKEALYRTLRFDRVEVFSDGEFCHVNLNTTGSLAKVSNYFLKYLSKLLVECEANDNSEWNSMRMDLECLEEVQLNKSAESFDEFCSSISFSLSQWSVMNIIMKDLMGIECSKKGIRVLWLSAVSDENKVVVVPFSENVSPDLPWFMVEGAVIDLGTKFTHPKDGECANLIVRLMKALSYPNPSVLKSHWKWGVVVNLGESILQKMIEMQFKHFAIDTDSRMMYRPFVLEKRAMNSMTKVEQYSSSLNRIHDGIQALHEKADQHHIEIGAVSSRIDSISHELRNQIRRSLKELELFITELDRRSCPTTFVLLDADLLDEPTSDRKQTAVSRTIALFRCLSSPMDTLKECLNRQLLRKYYIALVCELCGQLPDKDFYYVVTEPKFVSRVLPMAQAGLRLVATLNTIAKLGTCFGVPSLDHSTIQEVKEFLSSLGTNSLAEFNALQSKVEQCLRERRVDNGHSVIDGSILGEANVEDGYCLREFESWLSIIDMKKTWGRLSRIVVANSEANTNSVVFACPECCKKR